ncbi:radical SAM domain protein [Firmicutes bacterium CAG:313]|nr:radical SAM domain protein [Firmicutes bacterium CAG:313]
MPNNKKTIYLEITTKCNLACPFCPSSDEKNHFDMDIKKCKEVIDKIKDNVEILYFHVLGEPILHSNFSEIVEYAHQNGLKLGLTTNGVEINKITKVMLEEEYFEKINISLQCLIKFSNERRKKYLDNLKQFIVFKNMHSPKLPINLRLWNDKSKKEINDLNQKIEDTINDWLNEQNYQNIRFSYADEFVWPNLNSDIVLPYTNCLGAKKQIAILIDGSVVSCCLDYNGNTKIGNIFEEPFDTILNSQLFKNVVRGFCDKKPYFEICKKCSYRLRFK